MALRHIHIGRSHSDFSSRINVAHHPGSSARALPPQAESAYAHVFATASAGRNPFAMNSRVLRQLSTPSYVDRALLHGSLFISAKPIGVTDRRRRLRKSVTVTEMSVDMTRRVVPRPNQCRDAKALRRFHIEDRGFGIPTKPMYWMYWMYWIRLYVYNRLDVWRCITST